MPKTYQEGFKDGLKRAEEIAVLITNKFWDDEFARHGNAGVAKFKQKVGFLIEEALTKERRSYSSDKPSPFPHTPPYSDSSPGGGVGGPVG